MIEAVLFDLDGTLLDNDMERFMRPYLQALSARLAHIIPPAKFVECLMAGSKRMADHLHPQLTNREVFWQTFEALSGHSEEELQPIIDAFYAGEFNALQVYTRRRPEARPLVQSVIAAGRKAVLATHPLFPLIAVRQRMAWAGIADLPFDLITAYENMHFCKPQPEYYDEIARMLGAPAERCVMIGDDKVMDGPAAAAGMRFFWTTSEPPFDAARGDLAHLQRLIDDGWLDELGRRG
jgi:FMN phosphatase YigB (HAD superfamily)